LPEHLDVKAYPFLENPLVVVAPRSHPLAKEKNIPLKRLVEESFLMREPGSGTRRSFQKLLDTQDLSVRVRLELGSNEAIKQAIAGQLGLSVLSRHTLISDSDELTILDVEGFPISRQWYIVSLSGKQLSVVAKTFQEYLQEAAVQASKGGFLSMPSWAKREAEEVAQPEIAVK
jgi:LysR family transcriptional regulator, low CO2-responsive transcriptional regulator